MDYRFNLFSKDSGLRPFFKCKINGVLVDCLYDSGADLPVFCNYMLFCRVFAGSNPRHLRDTTLTGFGGSGEYVSIYEIPEFRLKSNVTNDVLILRNLVIAVTGKEHAARFILAAPVFFRADMLLSLYNGKLSISTEGNCSSFTYNYRDGKLSVYSIDVFNV